MQQNTAEREAMWAESRERSAQYHQKQQERQQRIEAAEAAIVDWEEGHPDPEERRLRRIACSMENEDIRQLMAENEQLREQLREARGATDAAR